MTRLPRKYAPKFCESLRWCCFSMTKMTSAHSTSSGDSGLSAPRFVPAEAVSRPGRSANTCSAVGLRRRFWLQMKRRRKLRAARLINAGAGQSTVVRKAFIRAHTAAAVVVSHAAKQIRTET